MTTRLDFDAQTGSFTVGNALTGATSGATAIITNLSADSSTTGTLGLNYISGTFVDNEIIYESALGSELVTNGDFANWAADNPDNWNVTEVGDATSNITENPVGQCQLISDGTLTGINQASIAGMSAGNYYLFSFDIKIIAVLGSGIALTKAGLSATTLSTFTSTGVNTFIYVATTDSFSLKRHSGATNITFDDVSEKQVTNAALAAGTIRRVFNNISYATSSPIGTLAGLGIMCDNTSIYVNSTDYYCDGSVVMRGIIYPGVRSVTLGGEDATFQGADVTLGGEEVTWEGETGESDVGQYDKITYG